MGYHDDNDGRLGNKEDPEFEGHLHVMLKFGFYSKTRDH